MILCGICYIVKLCLKYKTESQAPSTNSAIHALGGQMGMWKPGKTVARLPLKKKGNIKHSTHI
jgi:hypothetical protein